VAGDKNHGRPGIHDGSGFDRTGAHPTFGRGDVNKQVHGMPRFDECHQHFGGYFRRDGWPGSWRWRPVRPGWGWCNHFWFDCEIDLEFICAEEYCFSEYSFEIESGRFWWANNCGVWIDTLPGEYRLPITIRVTETVPVLDDQGQVIGYDTQLFLYVAVWDDANQAYGYYDWQDTYHIVSFPWLSSW
jgi:hypothetical protein